MKKGCFVFDIDGTVADLNHRRHFVRTKPANWGAFNSRMRFDTLIEPVMHVYQSLSAENYPIVFLSGREGTADNTAATQDWLNDNGFDAWFGKNLFLRKAGDYRGDEIVKLEMINEFVLPNFSVIGIFDDRPKVVRMWRDNGFFVFDVNQSGEEF